MYNVRRVLLRLDAEPLRRLIDVRGLAPAKSKHDMRSRIAKSYRGDMKQLVDDLLRKELLDLFAEAFETDRGHAYLTSAGRYDHDQLRRFARALLIDEVIPREFNVEPYQEDPSDGDSAEDDVLDADDEGDEDGEDPAEDPEDATAEEPLPEIGDDWSRPHKITRLLSRLDLEVPERLRTPRFQELITTLAGLGVQARPVDGTEPFTTEDESPGIAAKLRLRRVSHRAARRPESPPVLRTVRVVPGTIETVSPRRLPAWELALARLQLLTAVPTATRELQPEWPDGFVAAAALDLALPPERLRLLSTVVANYLRGEHDPFDVIHRLEAVLSAAEWTVLLDHFARLNSSRPAVVAHLLEYVNSRAASRLPATETLATAITNSPDLAARPGPSVNVAVPPHAEQQVNARSLGALADIFD